MKRDYININGIMFRLNIMGESIKDNRCIENPLFRIMGEYIWNEPIYASTRKVFIDNITKINDGILIEINI